MTALGAVARLLCTLVAVVASGCGGELEQQSPEADAADSAQAQQVATSTPPGSAQSTASPPAVAPSDPAPVSSPPQPAVAPVSPLVPGPMVVPAPAVAPEPAAEPEPQPEPEPEPEPSEPMMSMSPDAGADAGSEATMGCKPLAECGGECVDLNANVQHCGMCDTVCTAREGTVARCVAGTCTDCPIGFAECDGVCVMVSTDASNCGTCGHQCGQGQVCSASVCGCSGGQVSCNGGCINAQADANNCGECGNRCSSGRCSGGHCQ